MASTMDCTHATHLSCLIYLHHPIFSSLLPSLDKQSLDKQGLDLENLTKKKSYDDSFGHMQIKINFISNNRENWLELEFFGDQQKKHHKNPLGLRIHVKHNHFLATMANHTLMHTLQTQATTKND
jgi:hypothetical protein